ncbi:hypothetical protein ACFSTC_12730 [Nonomuraea ferruginea]
MLSRDDSRWSLTEQPGSLRVHALPGDTYQGTNTARNLFLMDIPARRLRGGHERPRAGRARLPERRHPGLAGLGQLRADRAGPRGLRRRAGDRDRHRGRRGLHRGLLGPARLLRRDRQADQDRRRVRLVHLGRRHLAGGLTGDGGHRRQAGRPVRAGRAERHLDGGRLRLLRGQGGAGVGRWRPRARSRSGTRARTRTCRPTPPAPCGRRRNLR